MVRAQEKNEMLSVFDDFLDDLQGGRKLCVMPVPRLKLNDTISNINGFSFYPASALNLDELRIVVTPENEFKRIMHAGGGHVELAGDELEWFKSATTQLSNRDFENHALVAFTSNVNWSHFLSGDHAYHRALLQEMSEKAELAMDLLRFDFCRLDLPDTLPGRVGTFGADNPYSGALFYTLQDHESYMIGGQVITHHLVAGLGLEISCLPSTTRIGTGETGYVARTGLNLLSAAMESNSLSSKFIHCMSLLDYLAYPDDHKKSMADAKREIAAHVATDEISYKDILDDIFDLTGRIQDGIVTGIRTNIVHLGKRFEELVLEPDRSVIFQRLNRYIGKTIFDLIQFSDEPWQAVEKYRDERKKAFSA